MNDAQDDSETKGYGTFSGLIFGHLAFKVKVIFDTLTSIVFCHFLSRVWKFRERFLELFFLDVEPQAAISSNWESLSP